MRNLFIGLASLLTCARFGQMMPHSARSGDITRRRPGANSVRITPNNPEWIRKRHTIRMLLTNDLELAKVDD